MFRRFMKFALIIMGLLLLAGCGAAKLPGLVDRNTLVIEKDGSITAYIISDFDKDYYKISELYSMAQQEAAAYNTMNGVGSVDFKTVTALEDGSNRVRAEYGYVSYEAYNGFNEGSLFYGVAGASDFMKLGTLRSVRDGKAAEVGNVADKHVIVTDEQTVIYCPYKVMYLSDGLTLNADGAVDTTQTEGQSVIVMSK